MTKDYIPNDNGYYSSLEQMKLLFERAKRHTFEGNDKKDFIKWQNKSRKLLFKLLGLNTFSPCENQLFEISREQAEGHTRIKYILQTEEKVYLPFYALIPDGLKKGEKRAAMICPHGHFRRQKESVAGVISEKWVTDDIRDWSANYGEHFVKMGYITFCPDARGFGERAEKSARNDNKTECSCAQVNRMAIPLGRCAAGMSVWDLIKLTDYISQREDCKSDSIGCAGLSGGGLQSLYFAAVDKRIKCVCVSGYFYGAEEALLELNHNCDCNYIPNLWLNFDMGDIAALIAPRPLLIESGSKDPLNGKSGIDNVIRQFEITLKGYKACGAEGNLKHAVFGAGHMWAGNAYPFFESHMPPRQ